MYKKIDKDVKYIDHPSGLKVCGELPNEESLPIEGREGETYIIDAYLYFWEGNDIPDRYKVKNHPGWGKIGICWNIGEYRKLPIKISDEILEDMS